MLNLISSINNKYFDDIIIKDVMSETHRYREKDYIYSVGEHHNKKKESFILYRFCKTSPQQSFNGPAWASFASFDQIN